MSKWSLKSRSDLFSDGKRMCVFPLYSVVRGTQPIHIHFKGSRGKPYGRVTGQGHEEKLPFCEKIPPGKVKGVSHYSSRKFRGL